MTFKSYLEAGGDHCPVKKLHPVQESAVAQKIPLNPPLLKGEVSLLAFL